MGQKPCLTDEEKQKICELYVELNDIYEVADLTGRSYASVITVLHKHGLRQPKGVRVRWTSNEYNQETHPIQYFAFQNRILTSGQEVDEEFTHSKEGFKAFVEYLGPIPSNLQKPSVGRFDHSKGYIKGNFVWQEASENSRECMTRTNLTNNILYSKDGVRRNQQGKAIARAVRGEQFITEAEFYSWKSYVYFDSYSHYVRLIEEARAKSPLA